MGRGRRTDLRVDLAGQLERPLVGSVSARVLLHGVTDQPQTGPLAPVHHPGSEDELLGQGGVDEPGEALGPTCTAKGRSVRGTWRDAPGAIGRTPTVVGGVERATVQQDAGNPSEEEDLVISTGFTVVYRLQASFVVQETLTAAKAGSDPHTTVQQHGRARARAHRGRVSLKRMLHI